MTFDILISVIIGVTMVIGVPVGVYILLTYAQRRMHSEFSEYQETYLSRAGVKHATK